MIFNLLSSVHPAQNGPLNISPRQCCRRLSGYDIKPWPNLVSLSAVFV